MYYKDDKVIIWITSCHIRGSNNKERSEKTSDNKSEPHSRPVGGSNARKINMLTTLQRPKDGEEERAAQRSFRFGYSGGGRFQHGGATETEPVHGQCDRAGLSELRILDAGETGHDFQSVRPQRLLHSSRKRRHIRGERGFQDKWRHQVLGLR